jgi:hypothetical protein
LLWTVKDMLSKALKWVSVSIGALLLENMEGRCLLRAFEIKRYMKRYVNMPCRWVSLSVGPCWGTWMGLVCRDL